MIWKVLPQNYSDFTWKELSSMWYGWLKADFSDFPNKGFFPLYNAYSFTGNEEKYLTCLKTETTFNIISPTEYETYVEYLMIGDFEINRVILLTCIRELEDLYSGNIPRDQKHIWLYRCLQQGKVWLVPSKLL